MNTKEEQKQAQKVEKLYRKWRLNPTLLTENDEGYPAQHYSGWKPSKEYPKKRRHKFAYKPHEWREGEEVIVCKNCGYELRDSQLQPRFQFCHTCDYSEHGKMGRVTCSVCGVTKHTIMF